MENLLSALMKDAHAAKFGPLRSACQNAIGKGCTFFYRAPDKRDIEDNSKTIFVISQWKNTL